MKKLLVLAAAVCCLASCNKELGPEYKTKAVLGTVTYKSVDVKPDEIVTVSVPITSAYGLYSVFISYCLDDDTSNVKQTSPYFYSKNDVSVVYTGKIPGQKAGKEVSFQVLAATPYNVIAWSPVYKYKVGEAVEPEPDPDPNPVE